MGRKLATIGLVGSGMVVLAVIMYMLGWHSAKATAAARSSALPPITTIAQVPRTFQDLIPQPGPNQLGPGVGQGQECKPMVLLYYQGRLYQLQLGPDNGQQGGPQSPPEYFPITPYQGPAIPGLPFPVPPEGNPTLPGIKPVNPRF